MRVDTHGMIKCGSCERPFAVSDTILHIARSCESATPASKEAAEKELRTHQTRADGMAQNLYDANGEK